MILLDCSEYMRNGDYIPSRLEAQQDAANLLVSAITQSHPESTVGVTAHTHLLVSPTDNVGSILRAIHDLNFRSDHEEDLLSAVQVAALALKHRRNKNGAQRIIAFCGSPIQSNSNTADAKLYQKAGRNLKKNNVAIDVVVLGETEENEPLLRELVAAANGGQDEATSHLIAVPAGTLPSEVIASSPILAGSAYATRASNNATNENNEAAFGDYGGIDPNMDPELAMALRISMEEERARQERLAQQEQPQQSQSQETTRTSANQTGISEEDALLQQALAMSMNEEPTSTTTNNTATTAQTTMDSFANDDQAMEDAEIQMAMQMSLQQEEEGNSSNVRDPNFVNELLGNVPGGMEHTTATTTKKSDDDDNEEMDQTPTDDKKPEGQDGKTKE